MQVGDIIHFEGGAWEVLGVGHTDGDETFVHLAHTTEGRMQRNGFCRRQINGWLNTEKGTLR